MLMKSYACCQSFTMELTQSQLCAPISLVKAYHRAKFDVNMIRKETPPTGTLKVLVYFAYRKEEENWEIIMHATYQVTLVVKNPLAIAGDLRDAGSVPGLERSPGGGNGNPFQDSPTGEIPMDRRAWCTTVHRVAKSQT